MFIKSIHSVIQVQLKRRMKWLIFVILHAWCACCGSCHLITPNQYYHEEITKNGMPQDVDPGPPLFLTPLIQSNKLPDAKNAARVNHPEFGNVVSYSGYFTVDKTFNSNLFFWFFPAEENYADAPVMVWLQGGPGDSSLTGVFVEHGPFKIISDTKIEERLENEKWTKHISMLYIDNPVGTGFSFTNPGGYCRNMTIVGKHLYEALTQFLKVFPELNSNDLFIAGESYGSKYAPALAHTIHENRATASNKVNLKGVAINSGFPDPINMMVHHEYLYQTGFVDARGKQDLINKETKIVQHINAGEWLKAYDVFTEVIRFFLSSSEFFQFYNYLNQQDPTETLIEFYREYVDRKEIRRALHVGNSILNPPTPGAQVYVNLQEDFMKSIAPWISELLDHYQVLIYNGQLDVIGAYPLTDNYLKKLPFSESNEYATAKRKIWKIGDEVAGYVKTAGKLTQVMVRNAGHLISYDQPKACYDLIHKFVRNQPIA